MVAMLRDATPDDFPAILALNQASVRFLSALTPERLAALHRRACSHRVALDGQGRVRGFLLAMREGSDYDSVNYRWFAARHPHFFYIDRVVVDDAARGQGLGAALYRDAFEAARAQGAPLLACEIDSDPPNPVSQAFHARFGFREVGTQPVPYAAKTVSLQVAPLPPDTREPSA